MSPCIVEPKPGVDVGRVVVDVTIENLEDAERPQSDSPAPQGIRRAAVETLVDTGATFLCLPEPVIRDLSLKFDRLRPTRTVTGVMDFKIYRGARLTVHDRTCTVGVLALPADGRALLGQIPLETLDYWVDVTNRRLVGNPEHDGEWMAEVF